jgi:hypothetical protein
MVKKEKIEWNVGYILTPGFLANTTIIPACPPDG